MESNNFESEVIKVINEIRKDPPAFAKELESRIPYYKGNLYHPPEEKVPVRTREGAKAVEEAVGFLKFLKPLGKLLINGSLKKVAELALDLFSSSKKDNKSNRAEAPKRLADGLQKYKARAAGESFGYKYKNVRDLITKLIIDDGALRRGNRKQIFSPNYDSIGVKSRDTKTHGDVCVIDYAGIRDKNKKLILNTEKPVAPVQDEDKPAPPNEDDEADLESIDPDEICVESTPEEKEAALVTEEDYKELDALYSAEFEEDQDEGLKKSEPSVEGELRSQPLPEENKNIP